MNDLENKLQKINVLVVDDMQSIRIMVKGCLRDLGANEVIMASNGQSAWDILKSTNIDLIICDWDMPQMSGIELLKCVKDSEKTKHIPFLMLTGTTEKERVVSAVKGGVDDYLSKPFQPKDLEYRVIKLLRKIKTP